MEGSDDRSAVAATTPATEAPPMAPLAVSGLVVTGAALVAALQPYLPQLVGLGPLDGGRYLLTVAGAAPGAKEQG